MLLPVEAALGKLFLGVEAPAQLFRALVRINVAVGISGKDPDLRPCTLRFFVTYFLCDSGQVTWCLLCLR